MTFDDGEFDDRRFNQAEEEVVSENEKVELAVDAKIALPSVVQGD